MNVLETKGLMVFYENAIALNNVSLGSKKGLLTGVFGTNSAGKSTLMYTLSGIILDIKKKEEIRGGERITVLGQIYYQGTNITQWDPSKRAKAGLILCPERRRIFNESSVMENLRIGGILANRLQFKDTLDYVLQTFPALKRLLKKQGGFLSGGEQQMLAIGRSLMAQPKVLLLDEPLLGMSPLVEEILVSALKAINTEKKVTMTISEQYARSILPIVHYAYILENGNVVLEGTSHELMENPDVKSAYFGL